MEVYSTVNEIKRVLKNKGSKKVGFVPTMGSLHQGHLSLVTRALRDNDIVVCSVFVNPAQFNNADDLRVYPRNLPLDINLLQETGCNFLFAPNIDEIYPNSDLESRVDTDFGILTSVMEAKYRPGHFDGVIKVVKRLFEIIEPTNAYFGQKDYQQLAIVKALVKQNKFNINILGCDIVREKDGLAMSSRNINLTSDERSAASLIPEVLQKVKEKISTIGLFETKKWVFDCFQNHMILKLEYFEIADSESLEISTENIFESKNLRAFIVVYAGKTRLIDNVDLN